MSAPERVPTHLAALLWGGHGGEWSAPGRRSKVRADHVLLDDDDGTIALLAFESLGRERVACDMGCIAPPREAAGPDAREDHRYLQGIAEVRGLLFARPGAAPPAALHRRRFAAPGRTLVTSCPMAGGAGAFGMLVFEAGPTELAVALAGEALMRSRPVVIGVKLEGELLAGVGGIELTRSIARRLEGTARGAVLEFFGPGVAKVAMRDRIGLASLAPRWLGASALFPSDDRTREALRARGRDADWRRFEGGAAGFDRELTVDLSRVAPNAAPASGARLGPFAEDADLRALARALAAHPPRPGATIDIVPGGRAAESALADGTLQALLRAGARLLTLDEGAPSRGEDPEVLACGEADEAWAPASVARIARALCGEEGALLAAQEGPTAGPSRLESGELLEPSAPGQGGPIERSSAHRVPALQAGVERPERREVVVCAPGDVRCADVLAWGPRMHAIRADATALAAQAFRAIDPSAAGRAIERGGGLAVVAGRYGAGEPGEAAARAVGALGIRAVVAGAFEPAHARALAREGVLPLVWRRHTEGGQLRTGAELELPGRDAFERGRRLVLRDLTRGAHVEVELALEDDERDVVLDGGLLTARSRARSER